MVRLVAVVLLAPVYCHNASMHALLCQVSRHYSEACNPFFWESYQSGKEFLSGVHGVLLVVRRFCACCAFCMFASQLSTTLVCHVDMSIHW